MNEEIRNSQDSKRKKYPWTFKLTAVVLSCIFMFLLAEIGVRLYDKLFTEEALIPSTIPGLPYENMPNCEYTRWGVNYVLNRYGIRDDLDLTWRKSEDERRIVFVGDSVFMGVGSPPEETIEAYLDRMIDAAYPENNWRVINMGTHSYDAWAYDIYFRSKALLFEPDVLVVGITPNDNLKKDDESRDLGPQREDREILRKILTQSRLIEYLVVNLRLNEIVNTHTITEGDLAEVARFIPDESSQEAIHQYALERNYSLNPTILNFIETYTDLDRWSEIAEPVASLCRTAEAHGIPVFITIHPIEYQLWEGYDHPEPQETIAAIIERYGATAINVLGDFQAAQQRWTPEERLADKSRYLIGSMRGDVVHPLAEGNEILARRIFESMQAQGIFD